MDQDRNDPVKCEDNRSGINKTAEPEMSGDDSHQLYPFCDMEKMREIETASDHSPGVTIGGHSLRQRTVKPKAHTGKQGTSAWSPPKPRRSLRGNQSGTESAWSSSPGQRRRGWHERRHSQETGTPGMAGLAAGGDMSESQSESDGPEDFVRQSAVHGGGGSSPGLQRKAGISRVEDAEGMNDIPRAGLDTPGNRRPVWGHCEESEKKDRAVFSQGRTYLGALPDSSVPARDAIPHLSPDFDSVAACWQKVLDLGSHVRQRLADTSPRVLLLLLFLIIAACVVVPLLFTDRPPAVKFSSGPRVPQSVHRWTRELKLLAEEFPSQERAVWQVSRAAVNQMLQVGLQPATLVLLAAPQHRAEVSCLMERMAAAVRRTVHSRDVIDLTLNISQMASLDDTSMKHRLAERLDQLRLYADSLDMATVRVVEAQLLKPLSAMLFHGHCDNENAPVKSALFLFSVISDTAPASDVQTELWKVWGSRLGEDIFNALMGRIGLNVIHVQGEGSGLVCNAGDK